MTWLDQPMVVLVIVLAAAVLVGLALAADRAARAKAWQQIALERRWDYERRAATRQLPPHPAGEHS